MKRDLATYSQNTAIFLLLGLPLLACGGGGTTADNTFSGSSGNDTGSGGAAAASSTSAGSGGATIVRSSISTDDDSGVSGATGVAPTSDANCGAETSETTKEDADVLLVLDRSGSMNESISDDCCCDNNCTSITSVAQCGGGATCTQRWPALKTALDATLSSTTGIHWGLKLFATTSTTTSPRGTQTGSTCEVGSGVEVPIASDSTSAIEAQVAAVSPNSMTPTAAAITAATAYLKTASDQNQKVILLATDGEPNCGASARDNNASDVDGTVSALQAALTAGFKTYVIGIGPSVGNLDNFAQAGGTEHYFPATSTAELTSALASITKTVASCTFQMSKTPPDANNVAVYLDGKLLSKDSTDGWSFGGDSQTVQLNGSSCERIQSGDAKKVQVLFGCPGEEVPQQIN